MPHFNSSDGLSLFYTDEGAGLPLLCLAGLTRTGADFDYVLPHLSGHRVIRLDYRGRGQSGFDPNWQNYTLNIECRDVLELLAHLGLEQVAVLGTSRGGLNAMVLAALAKDRLLGVALNDVGPVLDPKGLDLIMGYIGRNPAAKTFDALAKTMAAIFTDFQDVPDSRWREEAHKHYTQGDTGLRITYDPALRHAVEAATKADPVDLWPLFEALDGLPLACIRGANSNLLSRATLAEMQRRRPDMITTEVPGRGHVPFLDEPEALDTLHHWLRTLA
ncbi:MAG: pimeloyl-ACP methyl ester carboxylesterase [Sulfitobacter sp.]|jgi:pimeloyl-ACP methyl ester carboxylesterase